MLKKGVLVLAIMVLAGSFRLMGIGSFMVVDEENWMLRSAGFWHNIFRDRDTGGAFMTTHPGATLMWIAGGGIVAQEQRVGFDIDTSNLVFFRRAATIPVALTVSGLIGVVTWLLLQLYGIRAAAMAGGLLAVEPYLVGMSQITHLDMLLALFMLISLLAFWRVSGRLAGNWPRSVLGYLTLSGVAAGLAMGTKLLPALWLGVFFTGVVVAQNWRGHGGWRLLGRGLVRAGGFVFGVVVLTFYLVWPALWLTPDVLRSFNRDVPTIITDEHVAIEVSAEPVAAESFYVRSWLGRLTPHVHVLTLGVLLAAWRPRGRIRRADSVMLALYAVGFLLLITMVAKKGDRYALPALTVFPVVAGLTVAWLWEAGRERWQISRGLGRGVAVVVVAAIIAVPLWWSPYAIAYNNPLFPNIRPLSQHGWGEGLDLAAAWLNQHPLAEQLYVASWYPSVLATYFNGRTLSLSSRDDYRVSYVVTYRNMESRAEDDPASNVLDELADSEPVHTVYIRGVPYAWIYETLSPGLFTRHVGELVAGMEVGQTVPVSSDIWDRVDIGFATFSSRANTADVELHVRSTPEGPDVRTVRVNAGEIVDNEWHEFRFTPITGVRGATYYIAVTSPNGTSGNAVTVRYLDVDVLAGDMYLVRQLLAPGTSRAEFKKMGDVAYRLPD